MKKHKYTFASVLFSVVVAAIILLLQNNENSEETMAHAEPENINQESTQEVQEPQTVNTEYGLSIDSFEVFKGKIQRNQFLADILLNHGLSYPEIDHLVKSAKEVFDVRRIRFGRDYSVFCSKDSTKKAQCFVYEAGATDYVVFDLRDSVRVYKGEKPVETKQREAAGVITSSLFNALIDRDLSPNLALKMSEIYAWTIDFYRIQKGDYFKIKFDEHFVDGEFIGIGKIHSAVFNHMGNDFYAFRYEGEDHPDFYDEKGESLRKAFLQSPLKFGRISSGYTKRRFHPVQKRYKAHLGTDYAAPSGTPILSTGDGVVTEARYAKYNGNYVKVRHNGTYSTQYLHMSKIKSGIKPGVKVNQGDVIGYVGATGLATGPHVCYRFWKNGSQVNHRTQDLPAAEPISPEHRDEFMDHAGKEMEVLRQIRIDTRSVDDNPELS